MSSSLGSRHFVEGVTYSYELRNHLISNWSAIRKSCLQAAWCETQLDNIWQDKREKDDAMFARHQSDPVATTHDYEDLRTAKALAIIEETKRLLDKRDRFLQIAERLATFTDAMGDRATAVPPLDVGTARVLAELPPAPIPQMSVVIQMVQAEAILQAYKAEFTSLASQLEALERSAFDRRSAGAVSSAIRTRLEELHALITETSWREARLQQLGDALRSRPDGWEPAAQGWDRTAPPSHIETGQPHTSLCVAWEAPLKTFTWCSELAKTKWSALSA